MSHESQSRPPLYTELDMSPAGETRPSSAHLPEGGEQTELLSQILMALDKQNELLEDLAGQLCGQQKQRTKELDQWRAAHPGLVRNCRKAAETLGRIQTDYLRSLTREVNENAEGLADGDFLLNEFVDRYGPRMAHLNGVLHVLAQLSGSSS